MMERTVTTSDYEDVGQPTRVRWGAVIAGGVLAVALLLLLSSLWMALGFGSEVSFIVDNLEWFIGGSAIFCLFVGGWVAGRMSGVRGAGAGMAHGATLWAIVLLVTLAVGIPAILNILNLGRVATEIDQQTGVIAQGVDASLWATFLSLVGALVAAAIGGAIGGMTVSAPVETTLRRDPTTSASAGGSRTRVVDVADDDDDARVLETDPPATRRV
ncbi:MAG: hypothetical protein ACXWZU_00555 [Actinomycetota bacterium]